MDSIYKYKNFYVIFLIISFLIGINIYKDFGISIDEESTRYHGLVSFNYIIRNLNNILNLNILSDPNLPDLFEYPFKEYGVFFELILVSIEKIFSINEYSDIFYLRHLLTNFLFLISIVYFSKLIFEISNNAFLSIWGSLMLYSSPRLFAHSFYNSKDVIFLAFFIISIYYSFKFFNLKSKKYLILSCLSLSMLTAVRVIGVYFFLIFLLLLFIEILENRKNKTGPIDVIMFVILFFSFTYIFWPFLWENPFGNFIYAISSMSNYNWSGDVFYLGNYHHSHFLPWHYSLTWILISNSLGLMIIILLSFFFVIFRFFKRLIKVNDRNSNFTLWKNSTEFISFFNAVLIISPISLIIINNSTLYSGWRHIYFLFPSLLLIGIIGIKFFLDYFRKNKKFLYLIKIFCILLISINIFNLIKFHPYQNVYFNVFFEKKANKLFEIDYWGLSNVEMLKKLAISSSEVYVCNVGLMDLNMSKKMLSKKESQIIEVRGQDFNDCNFVIKNNIFLSNPKYTKKYGVPGNFKKIYSMKRGNIVISEIFEKQ